MVENVVLKGVRVIDIDGMIKLNLKIKFFLKKYVFHIKIKIYANS